MEQIACKSIELTDNNSIIPTRASSHEEEIIFPDGLVLPPRRMVQEKRGKEKYLGMTKRMNCGFNATVIKYYNY